MAFTKTKTELLKIVSGMENPNFYRVHASVYLIDGTRIGKHSVPVEVYRASNMREAGYISAGNTCARFRKWAEEFRRAVD